MGCGALRRTGDGTAAKEDDPARLKAELVVLRQAYANGEVRAVLMQEHVLQSEQRAAREEQRAESAHRRCFEEVRQAMAEQYEMQGRYREEAAALQNCSEELARAERTCSEAKQQLAVCEGQCVALAEALRLQQQQLLELQEQQCSCRQREERLEREVRLRCREAEELRSTSEDHRRQAVSLQSDLQHERQQFSLVQQRLQEASLQLENEQAALQRSKREVASEQAARRRSNEAVESLKAELHLLKDVCNEAISERNSAEQMRDQANRSSAGLLRRALKAEDTAKEASERCRKLRMLEAGIRGQLSTERERSARLGSALSAVARDKAAKASYDYLRCMSDAYGIPG